MAVNFGQVLTQVINVLVPLVHVPLVVVIDSLLALILDFNNVYLSVQLLPALVIMVVLLLVFNHKNLTIIYGCCVCVDVVIVVILSSIGTYVPALQNLMVNSNYKLQVYHGLCYYLIILTILGSIGERRYLLKLVILFVFLIVLGMYNYYWIIGIVFYVVGKISGIYGYARDRVFTMVNVFQTIGVLNATIYFYKARQLSIVLRMYWLSVFCTKFLFAGEVDFGMKSFLVSVSVSCNSWIQLFAMSLWLPELSYFVLWMTRGFLDWRIDHTVHDIEPRDLSKALVFFTLSSMNRVTDQDLVKRTFFLSIFMFMSFSYILQAAVKLTDGVLKSLSMSPQRRYSAHGRALTMMVFFLWFILYTSYKFCTIFPFQLWQLIFVSSNMVTVVQALSGLAVYVLFIKDLYESSNSTNLDDWVYYISAFSNSFEFLSAFLALSYGLWNVLIGTWTVIGLLIIILHTYCNIWLKAVEAWKIFMNRRTAATKLDSLANATKEELEEREDVCPICFDSLAEAKVTQCGHYFHSNCLRKWLYIKASCPLCHQDVLVKKVKED